MGMSPSDRDPADVLTVWALKEYERLQQEAPPISGKSIALFKQKFTDPDQAIPDIAEDKFLIKVYKDPAEELENVINGDVREPATLSTY